MHAPAEWRLGITPWLAWPYRLGEAALDESREKPSQVAQPLNLRVLRSRRSDRQLLQRHVGNPFWHRDSHAAGD